LLVPSAKKLLFQPGIFPVKAILLAGPAGSGLSAVSSHLKDRIQSSLINLERNNRKGIYPIASVCIDFTILIDEKNIPPTEKSLECKVLNAISESIDNATKRLENSEENIISVILIVNIVMSSSSAFDYNSLISLFEIIAEVNVLLSVLNPTSLNPKTYSDYSEGIERDGTGEKEDSLSAAQSAEIRLRCLITSKLNTALFPDSDVHTSYLFC